MKQMTMLSGVLVVFMFAVAAFAGDHKWEVLTPPADAGVHICTSTARPKTDFSVQCRGNGAFVRPSFANDGGDPATVTDVFIAADDLYDTPTTHDAPYICVRALDGGIFTTCTVFEVRGKPK